MLPNRSGTGRFIQPALARSYETVKRSSLSAHRCTRRRGKGISLGTGLGRRCCYNVLAAPSVRSCRAIVCNGA
jgi:hypothetical protein